MAGHSSSVVSGPVQLPVWSGIWLEPYDLAMSTGMSSRLSPRISSGTSHRMGLFTRRGGVIEESGTQVDLEGDTILDEKTKDELDSGDHERFAHYVKKEKIVESAVSGKPVTALCGKRWIPNRDPKKFPICPTCKEIYSGLRKGPDDSGANGSGSNNSGLNN